MTDRNKGEHGYSTNTNCSLIMRPFVTFDQTTESVFTEPLYLLSDCQKIQNLKTASVEHTHISNVLLLYFPPAL